MFFIPVIGTRFKLKSEAALPLSGVLLRQQAEDILRIAGQADSPERAARDQEIKLVLHRHAIQIDTAEKRGEDMSAERAALKAEMDAIGAEALGLAALSLPMWSLVESVVARSLVLRAGSSLVVTGAHLEGTMESHGRFRVALAAGGTKALRQAFNGPVGWGVQVNGLTLMSWNVKIMEIRKPQQIERQDSGMLPAA